MDKTSLTLGWLVGRQIAGQRGKKTVAYLYGEEQIRLPPLPELKYKYAVIHKATYNDNPIYFLVVSDTPPFYNNLLGLESIQIKAGANITEKFVVFDMETLEWAVSVYGDCDGLNVWSDGKDTLLTEKLYVSSLSNAVWTNVDIEKDGTLFLAASDPIPVYE